MQKKKFHSKASQFLYNRYIAGDPKRKVEFPLIGLRHSSFADKLFT